MMNLRYLLPAIFVAWVFSNAFSANSISQNTPAYAVLKGTVFDMSREAVVLDQKVVIENLQTGQVWRLATDEERGTFRAAVPAGVYSLSTEETHWNLPFRRAAFRLEPGISSTINVVLSPRILSIGLDIVNGYNIEKAPSQRYDSFSIPGASSDLLKLLIQYETRRTSKGATVYKWAKLSFGLVMVYADQLKLDRKTLRLIASGRVMVEDGKERRTLPSASIQFKDGKLIVEHEVQPTATSPNNGCAAIQKNRAPQFIAYEGEYKSDITLRLTNNSVCAIVVETDDNYPSRIKKLPQGGATIESVLDSQDGLKLRLHYLIQQPGTDAKRAYGWGDSVFSYEIPSGQTIIFEVPRSHFNQRSHIAVPFSYASEGATFSLNLMASIY